MERPASRELVRRALAGAAVPRPPVGPLACHYCAALAGVSLERYTLEPAVLADGVVRYWEMFRPDAVWVSADTWVTAEAMGAKVRFPGGGQPCAGTGERTVAVEADIAGLPAPDVARRGRMALMVEAVRRVRAALGEDVFVVACFDQYPFSLACALMGIDAAMLKAVDDPDMLDRLMARCAEHAVAYGIALADAGADMLSGGDSPAGLLGQALYRRVALPFEARVISALKARVRLPVSLHICGNAMPILGDMARTGADVLECDHHVDMGAAARAAGSRIGLWGNLDTVGVLVNGTPDAVHAAVRVLIDGMRAVDHSRYVVSSGCTLAVGTPAANVAALCEAARRG